MAEMAKRKATYDDLYSIPENMIGEIIDAELIMTPRPSRKRAVVSSYLGGEVVPPYCHGRGGGPGGWIILDEPEIRLGENILVPDLAGWRKERFPGSEDTNWISVCPDWVCEVLSPGTLRVDRVMKMPLYGQYGVQHVWLIDPTGKTLDVFRLEARKWVVAGLFVENDKVRAEPFQEIEIDLGSSLTVSKKLFCKFNNID
ncbi:MAG: Uma2 family endonuclease [Syntrophobacteraceae bacterium]